MGEFRKYLYRFGFLLAALALAYATALDPQSLQRLIWKGTQVVFAVALAELIWMIFFKMLIGKMEKMKGHDLRSYAFLRAIIYGSVILAVGLGL
jgi:FtsH-binding integral membrane protein